MAKFYGVIGYVEQVETKPGVWTNAITERKYYGDVTRTDRRLEESSEQVNSNITLRNNFSIVADAYAHDHFFAMRYIIWGGAYWSISDVEVLRPRMNLRLGGLYNGEKA